MLCIGGSGYIAMLVLMTTAIRVAVEICTYLFKLYVFGGICNVGSGIGGSNISWNGGGCDGKTLVV